MKVDNLSEQYCNNIVIHVVSAHNIDIIYANNIARDDYMLNDIVEILLTILSK